jgi:hypothetical protein
MKESIMKPKIFKKLQILYLKLKTKFNKDMTILAVDVANKTMMTFKNGSIIERTEYKETENIRGKRAKVYDWSDLNNYYSKEEIDNILKSYIKEIK